MAVAVDGPEHNIAKTIKDIFLFTYGLNASLRYLQEKLVGLELPPLLHRFLHDTDIFLEQHDQFQSFFSEHGLTALSAKEAKQTSRRRADGPGKTTAA
ncbi:MAG: hypothetical protein AB1424_13645 [Thermodesulfobacteriota bacterium]